MIQSFSRRTEADGLIQATIMAPMTVEALTAVTEVPAVEIRIMILIIVAEAPAVMIPAVMTVLAEILQAETPVVMTVLAEILQAETPVVVMTVLAITLMKEAVMMAELRQKQLQRPIQVQHK